MKHTTIQEGESKEVDLTPVKAIHLKCLDCSGFQAIEVRRCPVTGCPLYPYRMGKNPSRKGIGGQYADREEIDNLSGAL